MHLLVPQSRFLKSTIYSVYTFLKNLGIKLYKFCKKLEILFVSIHLGQKKVIYLGQKKVI